MRLTVSTLPITGRDHWHVSYSRRLGWCVLRAHATVYGHRYDDPLPGHSGFNSRAEAQAVKRQLREQESR